MLATVNVVHGSENHLYPALQIIGTACYPHSPSIDRKGIGPLHSWVASPAAPTPAAPPAMSPSNPWLTTEELCAQLAISRSTLFAIKRSGLLKPGRHLVPKNPGCRRSHLLWHLHRCELALGRQP
jgi:hypothetical protein